jgi:hypothetical protein
MRRSQPTPSCRLLVMMRCYGSRGGKRRYLRESNGERRREEGGAEKEEGDHGGRRQTRRGRGGGTWQQRSGGNGSKRSSGSGGSESGGGGGDGVTQMFEGSLPSIFQGSHEFFLLFLLATDSHSLNALVIRSNFRTQGKSLTRTGPCKGCCGGELNHHRSLNCSEV